MTNQIVTLHQNGKRDDADASPMPSIKRFRELIKGYDQMREVYRKLYRASIAPRLFDMTSDDAKRLVATLNNFDLGIHRPSKKQMTERLAALVGSFPNAAPHSPQVYARSMLAHVAAEEPNAVVLEATCIELVETKKFVPAISEVLKVLREQQRKWNKYLEVEEAVRSGRVKEMGDKLIEALQKRERGDRDMRPYFLPIIHPDYSYELGEIQRQYDRAYQIMGGDYSARKRGFKGLTDELEELCTKLIKAENAEKARYRNTPEPDYAADRQVDYTPQVEYQPSDAPDDDA